MPNQQHTIVIAEDDASARALLARRLEQAGYHVIACENGRRALAEIQRIGSCLVVTDWMMPEMDGLELVRAARRLSGPEGICFVYIILLTAHAAKDQIVAGLDAGADDYLTKPYHTQELLARLRGGARIIGLQRELIARQYELHKVNAEMTSLNRRLERLASTDELTGIANRRHLLEQFARAWSLAQRHDAPLTCVLFDIDHFKPVNDTHGHAVGDRVLTDVATVCRGLLRQHDVLGRIGGEEFCVLCPATDIHGAAQVAERIRRAIAAHVTRTAAAAVHVTVSLGAAARGARHHSFEALMADADAMLYCAKRGGRNQVWLCDAEGRGQAFGAWASAVADAPGLKSGVAAGAN